MSADEKRDKLVDSAGGKVFELFAMPLVRGAVRTLAERKMIGLLATACAVSWAPLGSANQFVLDHRMVFAAAGLVFFAATMLSMFLSRRLTSVVGPAPQLPLLPQSPRPMAAAQIDAPAAPVVTVGAAATIRARVVRSDVLMRDDWKYPTDFEVEIKPTGAPVDVSIFRLEWQDKKGFGSDDILARFAEEPVTPPQHFLLERPVSRRLAFLVPQRWHDQGFGRIVVRAGTEDVPSDWFPMLAPRR